MDAAVISDTQILDWLDHHNASVHCNFTDPSWTCTVHDARWEEHEFYGNTLREAVLSAMAVFP